MAIFKFSKYQQTGNRIAILTSNELYASNEVLPPLKELKEEVKTYGILAFEKVKNGDILLVDTKEGKKVEMEFYDVNNEVPIRDISFDANLRLVKPN